MTHPKLSFCIATFNRANLLRTMLDSIISQATSDCEIVVSDNASNDNTEQVVLDCARRFDRLRYFRQDTNRGPDRNFNNAVELASGDYCWLLADDDLLRPDAVASVLDALRSDFSLVLVNFEFMDFTLSKFIYRGVEVDSDRLYEPDQIDRLYMDAIMLNGFVGSFVLKREIWMARNRERYFDSYFIHIGVVYQERLPGKALMIARPLISMRMGNVHEWWPRHFDIDMNFVALVQSLALSELTKKKCLPPEPGKSVRRLLWDRALGAYSLHEYRRYVKPRLRSFRERILPIFAAVVPITVMNALFSIYFRANRHSRAIFAPQWQLQVLSESRIQRQRGTVRIDPRITSTHHSRRSEKGDIG